MPARPSVTVMTPDDQPNPTYLVVGDIPQPVALLALVSLVVVSIAWLVATSGELSIPAAWVYGK